MSPRAIAAALAARGVRLAALTDHNSALNCPAFGAACREAGIAPLFGVEAQSREECHILCLFGDLDAALGFGEWLYGLMPPVMNVPEKTGDQVYVDEDENIAGEVDKFLITSADVSLEELASRAVSLGALVIPAHVDRPSFSLSSQLGFIPDGPWDALEVVRMPDRATGEDARDMSGNPLDTLGFPLITSSDAHYPEHVGRRAFDLDLGGYVLPAGDAPVDAEMIRAALRRRPR